MSNAGVVPLKPTDSMINEELAIPVSKPLKDVYEETLRLCAKGVGSEWRAVKLKNCAIVRELLADTELVQFSMTLKNIPIAMVYETLLSSRTLLSVSPTADLISLTFTPHWYSPPLTALLSRHFTSTSKSALILFRSCEGHFTLASGSVDIPLMAFYIRYKEETSQLNAFFRIHPPKLCLFKRYLALKLAASFSKVYHSIALAPVLNGEESLPQDVKEVLHDPSLLFSKNPVLFTQLAVMNLDTGTQYIMNIEEIEEAEKQKILKSMTEYFPFRKSLTISQEDSLQQMKAKFPKETEHTLIRFLKSRDFNVTKAEKLLSTANEWKDRYKPEIIELTDVAHELQKGYVFRHYYDKYKRPALILRAARYFPRQIRVEEAERLILYLLESGIREMPKDVTEFCLIADMRDVGLINFSLPQFKHLAHLIQDFYPERLGSAFIINVSWVAKTLWRVTKQLLNQRTIEKIKFLETKEMTKLRETFDENVLPVDYGGLAQRLS